MTSTSARLRAAYVALAATDAVLAGTAGAWAHRARFLTKPLLMPTLAGSLLTSSRAARSPLRNGTLVAEAFGWGGDLALLRHGTRAFAAGTGSFGIGHIAYTTGFVRRRDAATRLATRPATRALAGIWLLSAPPMSLGAARTAPVLGPAVAAYSALLTTMTATALQADLPPPARRLTAAGAALFLVSDTLLGARQFLVEDSPQRLETVVMATYTAAQLLLAEGAARA
jgi:uncharacterized membrane protein YhhN